MRAHVISVTATPPQLRFDADYLDGGTAQAKPAQAHMEETGTGPVLVIGLPDGSALHWPADEIRALPDMAGDDILVLHRTGSSVARLIVRDEAGRRGIRARCDRLNKRPPLARRGKLFAWGAGAVASVALIIFVLVPFMADRLAAYLPPEGEKALGDATFEQIRSALGRNTGLPLRVCERAEGAQALAKVAARLEAHVQLPYPVSVTVLDDDTVNAFALPGGRVVIFRGLIDKAQNAEEVAAVLAHEVGHVARRDPARGALRSAGSIGVLGLLFGDFAGGSAVLFLVNRLIDATYSQKAEAAADRFAHETLARSALRPSALATFFERLKARGGQPSAILQHFLSHPELGDRIAEARRADSLLAGPVRPLLDESEWAALKTICR